MLKGQLLHPQILAALGRAGHSSKILISDGNYPHWTKRGPNAEMVYLNLAPGMFKVTDVLQTLLSAIVVEAAEVMEPMKTGPTAMKEDPPIWNEFRQILHGAGADVELQKIERFKFYEVAGAPDVCLTIATGEQRIYANLLLTIGVVKPK
ncbi:MAG: RbsD/FucU family protein [Bacillota bacterium]